MCRHAVQLPEPGLEMALGAGRVGARLLDPQPQAGQRRPELVRGVGDEFGLGAERAGQPLGHEVERARERSLLAAALDRRPRVEVARRDAVGGGAEPLDRPGDPAREQVRREQGHEQHREADGGDPDDRPADRVVDRVDALREPDRADDAPCLEHRPRGREDVPVQRVRVTLVLERPAVQRGGQLGAAGEIDAERLPARGVRHHESARVDDHHARPRRRADRLGRVAEARPVARLDQRADAGGQHGGLRPALGRTSLPTRSLRLSPSGTANATITRATR